MDELMVCRVPFEGTQISDEEAGGTNPNWETACGGSWIGCAIWVACKRKQNRFSLITFDNKVLFSIVLKMNMTLCRDQ